MCRDDRECIEHCLDGRPDAFGHLVGRYQGVLMAFLAGRLGSRDRAAEAAQETFVQAFEGLNRLRKRESFLAWLLGIGSRVAQRQRTVERRQRALAADARAVRRPEAERTETFVLERALSELPEIYREVILLRYYAGRSCAEVAGDLGVPVGTVTKRLSRAYAMLRESLEGGQGLNGDCEVRS